MYEDVDEDDEDTLRWCLRGYPVICSVLPPVEVDDLDASTLLSLLDAVCSTCLQRLEYERRHMSFAV